MQTRYSGQQLKILLLSSSYNGMTQRVERELALGGHQINTQIVTNDESMLMATNTFQPDIIICPTLMHKIPAEVFNQYLCLIIHPGIPGDQGAYSLDWAILNEYDTWGVTILEAREELDSGPVWAWEYFELTKNIRKTTLYNLYIVPIAVDLIKKTLINFQNQEFKPYSLRDKCNNFKGLHHAPIKQSDAWRIIDFDNDTSAVIIKKINAADGRPGVKLKLQIYEQELIFYGYGAVRESYLNSNCKIAPGKVIAYRSEAICVASKDGAIWVTQLRKPKTKETPDSFKLPATLLLTEYLSTIPKLAPLSFLCAPTKDTFQEISYQEENGVGILYFDFYNGAMSTAQCKRLIQAINECQTRSIKVLILAGSHRVWSNGIHLNVIHAAKDQALEAWENIQAINQIALTILNLKNLITIAALQTNAGAGGVYLALACDKVFAKDGVILNPHYKNMGLFGSELHTYSATKRIGVQNLIKLKESAKPILAAEAVAINLIDNLQSFAQQLNLSDLDFKSSHFLFNLLAIGQQLVINSTLYASLLANKQQLHTKESLDQIYLHEKEELKEMHQDMFLNRNNFQERRLAFLRKELCCKIKND